ncbi:helix-turn-helix transcriptional regulator [Actinoplanes sp. L3-i22]|uniref:helix-turn-helix domain-containing protein n=1 Tax=Actinoplanes sp. L3-i22 TaxID=2836373 RepID=UPI001C85FD90|nr:helix-turn-helix transcriptional regulator [Actinoplanes sp. L3-i22]
MALRKARLAADPPLSQSDVAAHLDWSLSKMQRIEAGEVTVSGTDLRALLDFYGSFTQHEIEDLVDDARISRRQRWWTKPAYREHVTPAVLKLMAFEAEAAEVRVFQPGVVPGVLQTPRTAGFILDSFMRNVSDEQRKVRQEVRSQRRRELIERAGGPRYYLIIDESVLLRDFGGVEIAAEQMAALVEDAKRPGVRVRVLPLPAGAVLAMVGAFILVDLNEREAGEREAGEREAGEREAGDGEHADHAPAGDDDDDAVLYREGWIEDELQDDPKPVRQFREYFEDLWTRSLDEEVSLSLITARAAVLRSSVDRGEP